MTSDDHIVGDARAPAERHREALQALTPELAARIAELTRGVALDLDAPIEGEVAL